MADEDNGDEYDQYDEDGDIGDDMAEGALEDAQKKDLGNELMRYHPEARIDTIESVSMDILLTNVPPTFTNADGQADPKHRSVPYLTQFERTKILGFRTNQLSQGARAYIAVPEHITDLREIARMELEARRLPIIVKRPMPDGTFEKWRLSDLLIL
jgi:DNA-directed RNA polymerase I, II, and III subunit RPABC2